MPTRIVKQPNGKLAAFSTIVDNFTACNMSDGEAVAYLMGKGFGAYSEYDARQAVARGVNDAISGGFFSPEEAAKDDGLRRWREAINTVRLIHGKKEAKEMTEMMSEPDGEEGKPEVQLPAAWRQMPTSPGWWFFTKTMKDWDSARPAEVRRIEPAGGKPYFTAQLDPSEGSFDVTERHGWWYGPVTIKMPTGNEG